MKERRINKIIIYLKDKHSNCFFGWNYQDSDKEYALIFTYDKDSLDYVRGCVISLNIRLTKKRYQEIERLLGLNE